MRGVIKCYVMDNGARFARTSREAFGRMEPLHRDITFRTDSNDESGKMALLLVLLVILVAVVFK
jgi:hypothetical protein